MEGGTTRHSRREGSEQPRLDKSGHKKRVRVVSVHGEEGEGTGNASLNDGKGRHRKRRKSEDFKKLKRDLEEVSKVVQQHLDELSRCCGLNLAVARTEILHKLEHHLKQSHTPSEEELEMVLKLMPPNSTRESAQKVLALKEELSKLRQRGLDTTAAIDELFRRFDVLGIKTLGMKRKAPLTSTQTTGSNNIHDSSQQLLAQHHQLQMLQQQLQHTKRQKLNCYDIDDSDHQFDYFSVPAPPSSFSVSSLLSSTASVTAATATPVTRRSEPSSPPRGWAFTKRKRSAEKPSSSISKFRDQHLGSNEGEIDANAQEVGSPNTKRQRMDFEFGIPSDMQTHGRRTRAARRGQEKDDEEEEEEEEEQEEDKEEEEEEGCRHRVLPYPLSSLGTTTEKENQHRMSNFAASAMPVHNNGDGI